MGKQPSLKRQSIYLFSGKTLGFIVHFITPVVLVRLLSKTDYGVYQQFNLLAQMLLPILGLCLSSSLYYFHPISDDENRRIFILQTFLVLSVVGLIFVITFSFLGNSILELLSLSSLNEFNEVIKYYILFMLVSSITDFLFVLEKKLRFNLYFYPLERLVRLGLIVFFVLLTQNTYGCVIALLSYSFCRFAFTFVYIFINYFKDVRKIFKIQFVAAQFKYSLPFLGSLILQIISNKYDKLIVNQYVEPSEYAVYSLAFINIPILHVYFTSIQDVVMPEISRCASQKDKIRVMEIWHKAIKKLASITIPTVLFFISMADEIITLLFTEQYSSAVLYYRIYLLSFFCYMLGFGLILRGFKLTFLMMKSNIISSIVTVLLGYQLIAHFKLTGAVITALIGICLPRFINGFIHEKKLLDLPLKELLPWRELCDLTLISLLSCCLIMPLKYSGIGNFFVLMISSLVFFPTVVLYEYKRDLFILPELFNKFGASTKRQ